MTRAIRNEGVKEGSFDDQLENDPRFLRRIEQARDSARAGRGVRPEDIDTDK